MIWKSAPDRPAAVELSAMIRALLAALVLFALPLAGCGGDDAPQADGALANLVPVDPDA